MKYVFGIDVGGTAVKAGLFDEAGQRFASYEIPTRGSEDGMQVLEDIAELITGALEEQSIARSDVKGIGIAVPGAVKEGQFVDHCANLNWGLVNIAEELTARTEIGNVVVLNDANAAALGEVWQGGGKDAENMVFVTLGTGVGGGVVVNGQIAPGAFGGGGEIGHIYSGGDALCGCGKRGCLEQYASATALVRMAKEGMATGRITTLQELGEALTAKDVVDAAKEGEPLALDVMKTFGEKLGIALSQISCVVDPEAFVIGGGVSKAGDFLLDYVRPTFRKHAFHVSKNAAFRIATLGNDAGTYGAAWAILQQAS